MTARLTAQSTTAPATASPVLRARLLAVAGAVVAPLTVWTIASPLAGVDLEVATGDTTQTVGVVPVLVASLLASLLGWGLLTLLEKRTPRARGIWTVVAVVVLALSLGGPLGAGVTGAAKVTLALLHVAVAAVLVPALRRTSPTR